MNMRVFPIDESPGFLIYRLKTQLAAALQRAFQGAGYDVTPEQWGVLSRLWEREGIHQSELAQRTEKDRHNMTRILKVLERNGFIQRRPSPEDRRISRVFLTREGRDLQGKLTPVVVDHLRSALAGLTGTDLKTMRRVHSHILKNLEIRGSSKESGRARGARKDHELEGNPI